MLKFFGAQPLMVNHLIQQPWIYLRPFHTFKVVWQKHGAHTGWVRSLCIYSFKGTGGLHVPRLPTYKGMDKFQVSTVLITYRSYQISINCFNMQAHSDIFKIKNFLLNILPFKELVRNFKKNRYPAYSAGFRVPLFTPLSMRKISGRKTNWTGYWIFGLFSRT